MTDIATITSADLLSSGSLMGWFTTKLAHMKLMNMSGSAFRCHPQMYWRDGILIRNHWNNSKPDDICIASDPDAKCIRGMDSSCSYGDPYPSLTSGQFVCVWQRGKWIKDGPWKDKILILLTELIETVRRIEDEKKAEQERNRAASEADKKRKESELLQAWS